MSASIQVVLGPLTMTWNPDGDDEGVGLVVFEMEGYSARIPAESTGISRAAWLEVAAAVAQDEAVCLCGHTRSEHTWRTAYPEGGCLHGWGALGGERGALGCSCQAFAAEPPAPPPPRPRSCPKEGEIPPFDAGWFAHEIGMERDIVSTLAVGREWALLGYDARAIAAGVWTTEYPDAGIVTS